MFLEEGEVFFHWQITIRFLPLPTTSPHYYSILGTWSDCSLSHAKNNTACHQNVQVLRLFPGRPGPPPVPCCLRPLLRARLRQHRRPRHGQPHRQGRGGRSLRKQVVIRQASRFFTNWTRRIYFFWRFLHFDSSFYSEDLGREVFCWTPNQQSLIKASFYYGYIFLQVSLLLSKVFQKKVIFFLQVPGGRLCEVIGTKRVLGVATLGIAAVTLLSPVVTYAGVWWLIAFRYGIRRFFKK